MVLNACHQNIPVLWPTFQPKALHFAKELGVDE